MAAQRSGSSGQLRVIGGRWRGRKFRFRAVSGLRPTPDRVRETLFNWLEGYLHKARCLDLFAGSGALGLEALSRGAQHCCFIDSNEICIDAIRSHLEQLQCSDANCIRGDALKLLAAGNPGAPYDIVFLDPPFDGDLLASACEALQSGHWLAEQALIYVEASARDKELPEFQGWTPHRDKRAGEVRYRLFVRKHQAPVLGQRV
jgi:16S rRNA (guanine966-N2)-methyltransferase